MTALGGQVSQLLLLAAYGPYNGTNATAQHISQLVALVPYSPLASRYGRVSQMLALVPYEIDDHQGNVPRVSQLLQLVVYGGASANETRSRAWAFVMDGHPMYVLDLGVEGTFIYDLTTKQWCKFATAGYNGWNMKVGTEWGASKRIVAADSVGPYVWELKPDEKLDEGFRPIDHIVTGGIPLRSRVHVGMSSLRVTASVGDLQSLTGVEFKMRFSDDNGKTYSEYYTVELTPDDHSQEIAFRSLGSFMAPGRVIELSDSGGPIRIDGCDAGLDNFEGDAQQPQGGGRGNGQQS